MIPEKYYPFIRYAYFAGAHCSMQSIGNVFAMQAAAPDLDLPALCNNLAASLKSSRDSVEFSKGFSDRSDLADALTAALLDGRQQGAALT